MSVFCPPFAAATRAVTHATCLWGLGATGCHPNDTKPVARQVVNDGEVRIAPNSPKSAWITVDTAYVMTEHVIATLPAQIVPDEGRTVRVTSRVVGRIVSLSQHRGAACVVEGDAGGATSMQGTK